MEQINRALDFYRMGFRISMIAAIVGLVLAVFFFFRFNVISIFMLITGRTKAKTVRHLEERNEATGKLRGNPLDFDSEELETAPGGSTGKKQGFSRKRRTGNTGSFAIPGDAGAAPKAASLKEETAGEGVSSPKDSDPMSLLSEEAADEMESVKDPLISESDSMEGQTEVLDKYDYNVPSFRVIEDIVVIHTDELII